MSQSKSASQDRGGFGMRTAPALLVHVIRSILVATACHAHAGEFDAAEVASECVTRLTFSGARPTDIVLERWGAFLVRQAFDGVHETGPAGADVTPRPALTDGAPGRLVPAEVAHLPSRSLPTGPMQPPWGAISELRGGVLNHDVIFPNRSSLRMPNPFRQRMEGGVNLNGEVIFVAPGFLRYLGSPRPRLGGSLNARGYTDNAYLDLDWDHQFTAGPFVEGYLGLAWHDGKLTTGNPERIELGLRVLFHLGLEAGWRFHQHHGLSLMWEHMSNSTLGSRNQGVDSLGLRYGYRFDVQ